MTEEVIIENLRRLWQEAEDAPLYYEKSVAKWILAEFKPVEQEPELTAEENYIFSTSINKGLSGIINVTNPPKILCFCSEENGKMIIEAMKIHARQFKPDLREELIKFADYLDIADSEYYADEYLNKQKP